MSAFGSAPTSLLRPRPAIFLSIAALVVALALALLSGGALLPFEHFMSLRLPRAMAAILVGSGLGLAATLLQTVTRNPLAEPGLLGVNAGGVLGLVLGISWAGAESIEAYMFFSGIGALAATALVLSLGRVSQLQSPAQLILLGMAVSATLGGFASFILMAESAALEQFRFWHLGSLSGVTLSAATSCLPFSIGAILLLVLSHKALATLELGADKATSLGAPVLALQALVWILSALFTAIALALAGPVLFAGFLAAQWARRLSGPRFGLSLSLAGLWGAVLVLFSDTVARSLLHPFELPLGVFVSLLGAPLVVLMARRDLRQPSLTGAS